MSNKKRQQFWAVVFIALTSGSLYGQATAPIQHTNPSAGTDGVSYVSDRNSNTMTIFDRTRSAAEMAYFLSAIGLLCVGARGLRQIYLLKDQLSLLEKETQDRNRRASLEQTMAHCERFANYILSRRAFVSQCQEKGWPIYTGAIGDFSIESLGKDAATWQDTVKNKMALDSSVGTLNQLELISAAFISGLADDDVGFKTIGLGFCATVASHYDIFSVRSGAGSFQNVRELYKIWSSRIILQEFDQQRKSLSERMNSIPNHKIASVGVLPSNG